MDLESWQRGETPLFREETPARSVAPKRVQPRFLGDGLDSDEDEQLDFAPRDVDKLFDLTGVEDKRPETDAYDPLARLKEGGKEGEGGEAKVKRAPRPKLDEERLLGPRGMPKLKEELAKFKLKGKGKEREDLSRLLGLYQLWAHQMFPKAAFADAVDTVEKLCHKRGMQRALKDWREDARRAKHGLPPRGQGDEPAVEEEMRVEKPPPARSEEPELDIEADALLDAALEGMSSQAPMEDYGEMDDEAEAMMRELEGGAPSPARPPPRPAPQLDLELDIDDQVDLAAMEEIAMMEQQQSSDKAAPDVDALLEGLGEDDFDMDF